MYKMTTAQNLELGKQYRKIWHRGRWVVSVKLGNWRSYPYRFTYADGQTDFFDASEIVTDLGRS